MNILKKLFALIVCILLVSCGNKPEVPENPEFKPSESAFLESDSKSQSRLEDPESTPSESGLPQDGRKSIPITTHKKIVDSFNRISLLNMFSRAMYVNVPDPIVYNSETKGDQKLKKIIYNNDGFNKYNPFKGKDKKLKDSFYEKGKKLEIDVPLESEPVVKQKLIPVGYTMFVPDGEIKAVLVRVYGGGTRRDLMKQLFVKPSKNMNPVTEESVKNGIAVVAINSFDLLGSTYQHDLSEVEHQLLHASIDKVYKMLTGRYGYLSNNDDIKNISDRVGRKEIPIALYGVSFGGRTAVRHAELYPDTFTRYVSISGVVSYGAQDQNWLDKQVFSSSSWPYDKYLKITKTWLDPEYPQYQGIRDIKVPVMLMANLDDHNVSALGSIAFFETAQRIGKGNLVFLKMYAQGRELHESIAAKVKTDLFEEDSDYATSVLFTYKGHSPGSHQIRDLVNFIINGPDASDIQLSLKNAKRYRLYLNKYLTNVSEFDWFISEAFHLYNHSVTDGKFKVNGVSPADLGVMVQTDKTWETVYLPLYRTIKCLSDDSKYGRLEITKIMSTALNSDAKKTRQYIENSLLVFLPEYLQFIVELQMIATGKLSIPEIAKRLAQDQNLQNSYKEMLKIALGKLEEKSITYKSGMRSRNVLKWTSYLISKSKEPMDPFLRDKLIYAFLMGNQGLTGSLAISPEEATVSKSALIDIITSEKG